MHTWRYRMRILTSLLAMYLLIMSGTAAMAFERFIYVNFSTGTLTVTNAQQQTLFQTAVVLPRGNYYSVPVSGTVFRAEMGPRWTPTAKMHRDLPGRYRASYGPYERGNAMGHCKLSINFDSPEPILKSVRIHGNAKEEDLGQRKSRSCIRIPDDLCSQLVQHTIAGSTFVKFHW